MDNGDKGVGWFRRSNWIPPLAAFVYANCVFWPWVYLSPHWQKLYPWSIDGLRAFFVIILTVGLVYLQSESGRQASEQLWEFVVGIFMAVAISIIAIGESKPIEEVLKYKALETCMITFVIFAVTTIGKSSRLMNASAGKISRLQKTVDDLNVAAHTASEAITEARYGGLAAKAMGFKDVKELPKNSDGKLDAGVVPALEPALGALRAWIQAGKGLGDQYARPAWWRVMSVYHQEETYDISNREVATNVRSYAYILIAVISELLDRLGDDERLAVANVSAFAPKDFYNFPNGRKGTRFYHEAEFFGIYRRLLGVIAADDRVRTYRVILADPSLDPDLSVGRNSQIDWEIDAIWKLVLDCARLHMIVWPIVGPMRGRVGEDLATPNRRSDWQVNFPAGHDPVQRLPRSTSKFLWVPTYADVRNLIEFHGRPTTAASKWLKGVLPYEEASNPATSENGLREKATRKGRSDIETRVEKMRKECEDFCAIYLNEENHHEPANIHKRLSDAWQHMLDAFFFWLEIECADQQRPIRTRIELLVKEPEPEKFRKALNDFNFPYSEESGQYLGLLNKAWQKYERLRQLKPQHEEEFTDLLLQLADLCHDIDASGKYLQIECGRTTENPEHSSTGVELGLAENWLHRLLIVLEAKRIGEHIQKSGPLPVWRLMAFDLCGICSDQLKPILEELGRKMRVCTISRDVGAEGGGGPRATTSRREMDAQNIFPEFLMVGILKQGSTDLKDVEWQALVGATISEPFQTCRIQMHFPDSWDKRIDEHKRWLLDVWERAEPQTLSFLSELSAEIGKIPSIPEAK